MLSTFRPTVGTPDTGRLEVVVELGTVCSNRFPTWKPSDQAIAISHFVARTLKGAGVVDLKDLIIKKGAAAFILNISVTCLNYDGNVEDAALLAAVLALLDTKLPPVQVSATEMRDITSLTVSSGQSHAFDVTRSAKLGRWSSAKESPRSSQSRNFRLH
eukprot:1153580-Rhodomonas_salina.1